MRLTATEIESPLWKKINAHLQERLERHRVQNDATTLTEVETARLRGKIAETKYWLVIGRPEEFPPGDQ